MNSAEAEILQLRSAALSDLEQLSSSSSSSATAQQIILNRFRDRTSRIRQLLLLLGAAAEPCEQSLRAVPTELRQALRSALATLRRSQSEELRSELRVEGGSAAHGSLPSTVLGQSKELSRVLRRAGAALSEEVKRTSAARLALSASTGSVRETVEELRGLKGRIDGGSEALKELVRRETWAKRRILLALAVFFSAVLFVLHQRLGIRIYGRRGV